jgi:Cu-processing system permease protein
VDTISGEVTSGTIHTLAAKPVHRWEIILGKWIGLATMLTLYVLLMGGSVMGLIYISTGYTAPNALRGLLLMELNGLLLVSITLWGSTWLSTLANGVLVLVLFGISFVGGWIEQIGALVENQAAVNIGIISSLLLPTDALWRRAAFEMDEPLANLTGFALFSSNASVPSPAMIGYAVVYTMMFLMWAVWIFSKQDL